MKTEDFINMLEKHLAEDLIKRAKANGGILNWNGIFIIPENKEKVENIMNSLMKEAEKTIEEMETLTKQDSFKDAEFIGVSLEGRFTTMRVTHQDDEKIYFHTGWARKSDAVRVVLESDHVIYLKTETSRRFGEIKAGDKFDLSSISPNLSPVVFGTDPDGIWFYNKSEDYLLLDGCRLYQRGKWARKTTNWEGVEFWKGIDGIARPMNEDFMDLALSGTPMTSVPSTEAEYEEQLKQQMKDKFGVIQRGDIFDLSIFGMRKDAKISARFELPTFKYRKDLDAVIIGGVMIYWKGKWATRAEKRIKVQTLEDFESRPTWFEKSEGGQVVFNYTFNLNKKAYGINPADSYDFLASQLEKFLNGEIEKPAATEMNFIATGVTMQGSHISNNRDALGLAINRELSLTAQLNLTSVGDFSKYIKENQAANEELIAEDILSGKLKIG